MTNFSKKSLSNIQEEIIAGRSISNQNLQENALMNLFLESPTAMGLLTGSNHTFQMVNDEYLKMIERDAVVGFTVEEILPEAVDQGFLDILDEVYQTSTSVSAKEVLVFINKSGGESYHYLDYVFKPFVSDSGDVNGILFFVTDVTEKVKSRLAIEISEQKLREAQKIGHISNFELDLKTNVITWSDELFDQFQYLKGQSIPSIELFFSNVHPEDIDFVLKEYKVAFSTFHDSDCTYRIIVNDGTVRFIHAKYKFEFDQTGEPIRLYGII